MSPLFFPHFGYENTLFQKGYHIICGLDEAGRGALSGPVVAACVVLDPQNIPAGLNDSKKLSQKMRERLYTEITSSAAVGVGCIDVATIDRVNILNAALLAMREAFLALSSQPEYALVDGPFLPNLPVPQEGIIKGDQKSLSIAAASIVAKVTRDQLLCALEQEAPGYGFAQHKGYGTKKHLEALKTLGPSPHHRRSFAPVREYGQTDT